MVKISVLIFTKALEYKVGLNLNYKFVAMLYCYIGYVFLSDEIPLTWCHDLIIFSSILNVLLQCMISKHTSMGTCDDWWVSDLSEHHKTCAPFLYK